VLELLTQYLTAARRVTIPAIGTLQLEYLPAARNVVDQELLAPGYLVNIEQGDEVSEAQSAWLCSVLQEERGACLEQLRTFGTALAHHLQHDVFLWPGVGLMHRHEGILEILPEGRLSPGPIRAERVLREDARHTVLSGDQERVAATETTAAAEQTRQSDRMWLAWLLAVLAALLILYFFYAENFSVHASGMKTPASNALLP